MESIAAKGTRTLRSGRGILSLAKSVKLTIDTQAPDKWLFVDLETGDIWVKPTEETSVSGYGVGSWRGINKTERRELLKVAKMRH